MQEGMQATGQTIMQPRFSYLAEPTPVAERGWRATGMTSMQGSGRGHCKVRASSDGGKSPCTENSRACRGMKVEPSENRTTADDRRAAIEATTTVPGS